MKNKIEFSNLLDKTIIYFKAYEDEIEIITSDDSKYIMDKEDHWGCCEKVWVSDIVGDIADILNEPILRAEIRKQDIPDDKLEVHPLWGSGEWTFYELCTQKGCITIRWSGETPNAYYSIEVGFFMISNTEENTKAFLSEKIQEYLKNAEECDKDFNYYLENGEPVEQLNVFVHPNIKKEDVKNIIFELGINKNFKKIIIYDLSKRYNDYEYDRYLMRDKIFVDIQISEETMEELEEYLNEIKEVELENISNKTIRYEDRDPTSEDKAQEDKKWINRKTNAIFIMKNNEWKEL